MSDILQNVDVRVRCVQCEETYDVSAAMIAEAQRLVADGCPGTAHECLPSFLASLIDPSALESLRHAWRDLERNARGRSEAAAFHGHARVSRHVHSADGWREIARWEDDGGAAEASPPS